MSNFNQCTLVGNLTADPELVYIQSGTPKTNFTIAVNNPRSKKDDTLFLPVTVFGKLADIVQKFGKKGQSVLVSGRLSSYKGDKGTFYSLIADEIQFLNKMETVEQPKSTDTNAIPF